MTVSQYHGSAEVPGLASQVPDSRKQVRMQHDVRPTPLYWQHMERTECYVVYYYLLAEARRNGFFLEEAWASPAIAESKGTLLPAWQKKTECTQCILSAKSIPEGCTSASIRRLTAANQLKLPFHMTQKLAILPV